MVSQRELRFYASIPKILVMLIASACFTCAGWRMLQSGADAVAPWFVLGFFGLCMLVALVWLGMTIVLRKPLLRINDAGITSFPALAPWRSVSVAWVNAASVGVRVRRSRRGLFTQSTCYFVVQARHPDQLPERTTRTAKWALAMYPTLASAAIAEPLRMMFLISTRERRAQMLERIKTTFVSEIIQYNVWVDQEERPL